jgi:hypothetical protein
LYASVVPVVAHYGDALAGKVIVEISNPFNSVLLDDVKAGHWPVDLYEPSYLQRPEVDRREAELVDDGAEPALGLGIVAGVEQDSAADRVTGFSEKIRMHHQFTRMGNRGLTVRERCGSRGMEAVITQEGSPRSRRPRRSRPGGPPRVHRSPHAGRVRSVRRDRGQDPQRASGARCRPDRLTRQEARWWMWLAVPKNTKSPGWSCEPRRDRP